MSAVMGVVVARVPFGCSVFHIWAQACQTPKANRTAGNGAGLFALDSETWAITVVGDLSSEAGPSFTLSGRGEAGRVPFEFGICQSAGTGPLHQKRTEYAGPSPIRAFRPNAQAQSGRLPRLFRDLLSATDRRYLPL